MTRPPSTVREQLEDLWDVQAAAREQARDDVASRVTMRQLRQEEVGLLRELRDAKEKGVSA